MKKCVLLLNLFLMIGALSSCSVSRKAQLEKTVNNYVLALRLGDENALISYIEPSKQPVFAKKARQLEGFHISNAQIKTIFPDEEVKGAYVTVLLEYFANSGTTLMTSRRSFKWKYDEKHKAWLLDESSPVGSGQ